MQGKTLFMKTFLITALSAALIVVNAQPNKIKQEESNDEKIQNLRRTPSQAFLPGEFLKYRVHYGIIDAGEATVEIKDEGEKINGRKVYHMVGNGYSKGTFNWFFKVKDTYESYVDADGLFPWRFKRDCNEGGFIIKQNYSFFPQHGNMYNGDGKWLKTPQYVQDMVSSFYYARSLNLSNLKNGDLITVQTMVDSELWPFTIKYVGKENIKVGKVKYRCLKFRPVVQKGRIFKDEEDLSIWITDDGNRIPIMAEAKILFGSLKMELTDYKNLAHPLAIVK